MCGILGSVGNPHFAFKEKTFLRALDLIRHRGPDSGSIWNDADVWLGHRRLAIVDLENRANQPMCIGDFVIVLNGEI